MNVKITGIVTRISEPIQAGENLKKVNLVIKTIEERPQVYPVEFLGDKATLLKGVKVGEIKIVSANLNGREWTKEDGETSQFVSLSGWKVDNYTV